MRSTSWLWVLGGVALLVGAALFFALRGGEDGTGIAGVESVPALSADSVEETAGDSLPVGAATPEVRAFLDEGRWWRASRGLASQLASTPNPLPETIFLAARAEAGWGGWESAVEYLRDQPWLDSLRGGEGWFWLARGLEETDRRDEAMSAYERYLRVSGGADTARAAIAEFRRALTLLARGQTDAGTAVLGSVRARAPYAEGWIDVLAAEALAEGGDTAAVRRTMLDVPAGNLAHRVNHALIDAYVTAGDTAGAVGLAAAAAEAGGTPAQRASFLLAAGRLRLAAGDTAGARRDLLASIAVSPGSASGRDAANLVVPLGDLAAANHLAIADVYDRHGNADRAVAAYRAWLAASAGATAEQRAEVRLRLGRSLFAAGNFNAAETEVTPLFDASPAVARQAMLLAGRARNRRGDNPGASRIFDQLASRFPGSAEGAEGLYLVADLAHDAGDAASAATGFQRVASGFPGTERAGLATMRLAGMRYLAGDYPGAAALWDGYRTSHAGGAMWSQATYWAGRAREAAGDTAAAAALYEEVRDRDPLSYYAVRAADRLGVDYWPVAMPDGPAPDSASTAEGETRVRTIDLLREAGLHADADAEALRLAEEVPGTGTPLDYALAEALNQRGYSIRGIALGQRMQRAGEPMNLRLLRILYPFPFRELIEAEARERGLDPAVVAALSRQESLFTPRITSPVGARGLMQIMPETGAALARGTGIEGWEAELLYQPEINAHLGIRYLDEQMRRYGGSLPSVFSAYNAGPHRIDVWMAFPEYRDEELFTERIPYRETRDYVKILTRNIELYRGLYGTGDPR